MTLHGAISCLKTTPGYAVKYTVEHYRKDGVSGEAFTRWFTQQFLPRAIPILKKHNILRHAVKTDIRVGPAFQAEADLVRPSWKTTDCDLVLEYWVDDIESIKSLVSDPEWALEDEDNWLDVSRSSIRIGYETTYLEYGAIVNVAGQRGKGRVSASFD